MNVTCPNCKSEDLQQGVDDSILCNKCKRISFLLPKWKEDGR